MNDQETKDAVKQVEHDVYVSIKDYFDAMQSEQDRRIEQALAASRLAVDKAEKAQERRLDLLNEFRAQASDESKKYALRDSTDERIGTIEKQISRLYGGLVAVAFIGVADVVKLWFTK